MNDFYYILGLDPNCSSDQIKEAYRKLSKKLHPDLNQGDAYFEARFKDIKEAFETLRDPLNRRLYDEQLNKLKADRPNEEPVSPRTSGKTYRYKTRNRPYTPSSAAKPGNIRRKGPGIGLSLTMIILGCILAVYAVRWFAGSKPKKQLIYAQTVPDPAPQPLRKKHRHKHALKPQIAAESEKETLGNPNIVAIKPDLMKPMPAMPQPVKPPVQVKPEPLKTMIAKTWPDSDRNHSDYLYTTYVHPNVTGIVPLRQYDRFNSGVIASIPANSRVFVLERGNTYYRIFYDNSIGFVPKWSLRQK